MKIKKKVIKPSEESNRLLIRAIWDDELGAVIKAIENGADLNADVDNDIPIILATHNGYTDIVELLIAKGADINGKTSLGQTPLQLAQERRNTQTIELLRKHGAKE